jgi:hypothetical protein
MAAFRRNREPLPILRLYNAEYCRMGVSSTYASYNQMVLRHPAALLTVAILLMACGNGMKSKEKVQAAIVDRIQSKTGLDLKNLDVSHGMEMKYTLEQRDGQWQVVTVSDPRGNPARSPSGMGGQLPPGHPSIEGAAPGHPGEIPAPRQGGQTR